MRGRAIVTVLILMMVGMRAAHTPAQQKPFSQSQVQGMVQSGLGDETGAKAITQRGLDFVPTEDFLQSLQALGANAAFLAAVRSARHPQASGGEQTKPLTQVQIFALLSGKVASHRVTMLVQERGIDFEPTADYLQEVRLAGGEDELIDALKNAKVTKRQNVDPAQAARQTDIRQHTARGAEFMRNGRFADAETEYRAAVRLSPQDADLHFNLGLALGEEGNADGAAAEFRESLRLNPNNEWAHGDLGIALGTKGDFDGEIAEEREALRLNPNNENAHVALGVAEGSKGDLDAEISEEREALRLNPNNDAAHVYLGIAEGSKGDFDAEISEERAALNLNPKNEGAHVFLGVALGAKGDWNGEIAEERSALSINPRNEGAHVYLGAAMGNKGDWNGQAAEEREALRLNPNNELAHAFLGSALVGQGDLTNAEAEFREAIRLNPKDASAHNSLGLTLQRKGDILGAIQEYRTALELNPQNSFFRQNLERLLGGGNTQQTRPQAQNDTEVPGLDLTGLTGEQREAFIKQLAGQTCPCGCGLTLLKCRQVDHTCATSLRIAQQQLDEFRRKSTEF